MGVIARSRQYFSQVEGQARRDLAEVEAETDGDPRDLANVLQDMADIELGLGRTDAAVQLTRRAQATVDGFEDKYSIAVWSGVNADLYSRIQSDERRGGKESVSPCRLRCGPLH